MSFFKHLSAELSSSKNLQIRLRIFAVLKETEFEAVKAEVTKRIHQARLYAGSVQFRSVDPDDIAAYASTLVFQHTFLLES